MRPSRKNIAIPAAVFVIVAILLSVVQTVPDKPLLLAERLFCNGGWLQVFIVAIYGAFLTTKMIPRENRTLWRIRSWTLFTAIFYTQLILGIAVDSIFLFSGKLHVPVPAILIAGPLYRFSSWFMIILFLSTLMLTGPAWCSHLCYFGSLDAAAAGTANVAKRIKTGNKKGTKRVNNLLKISVLLIVVTVALILRLTSGSKNIATLLAILFGVAGLGLILFISRKKGYMYHCTNYCPLGTLVNRLKFISPFRFRITEKCTKCYACTKGCRYAALQPGLIDRGKIGSTCTYCGDCLTYCRESALEYKFLKLSPEKAEKLWIALTVILHSLFLTIARV